MKGHQVSSCTSTLQAFARCHTLMNDSTQWSIESVSFSQVNTCDSCLFTSLPKEELSKSSCSTNLSRALTHVQLTNQSDNSQFRVNSPHCNEWDIAFSQSMLAIKKRVSAVAMHLNKYAGYVLAERFRTYYSNTLSVHAYLWQNCKKQGMIRTPSFLMHVNFTRICAMTHADDFFHTVTHRAHLRDDARRWIIPHNEPSIAYHSHNCTIEHTWFLPQITTCLSGESLCPQKRKSENHQPGRRSGPFFSLRLRFGWPWRRLHSAYFSVRNLSKIAENGLCENL